MSRAVFHMRRAGLTMSPLIIETFKVVTPSPCLHIAGAKELVVRALTHLMSSPDTSRTVDGIWFAAADAESVDIVVGGEIPADMIDRSLDDAAVCWQIGEREIVVGPEAPTLRLVDARRFIGPRMAGLAQCSEMRSQHAVVMINPDGREVCIDRAVGP